MHRHMNAICANGRLDTNKAWNGNMIQHCSQILMQSVKSIWFTLLCTALIWHHWTSGCFPKLKWALKGQRLSFNSRAEVIMPNLIRSIRGSQKFCNILVTWSTIQQLWMFLLRSRSWKTTLDCETPNLLDTLNANCHICLHSWEHSLRIYCFRPTWPCLIVGVLVTRVKFIELCGQCTLCTTNVIGCFCGIMGQFEVVKHKFLN